MTFPIFEMLNVPEEEDKTEKGLIMHLNKIELSIKNKKNKKNKHLPIYFENIRYLRILLGDIPFEFCLSKNLVPT